MSLNADKARLLAITKEISLRWDETKVHWRDSKAQEFEKKYIEELQSGVETAITVIDQLDKLINQIRSDCE